MIAEAKQVGKRQREVRVRRRSLKVSGAGHELRLSTRNQPDRAGTQSQPDRIRVSWPRAVSLTMRAHARECLPCTIAI